MIHRRSQSLIQLTLLAALCAALPGCQAWNAWLDLFRWRGPADGNNTTAPLAPKPLAITAAPTPGVTPAQATPLVPRVMLYQITMPVGEFSGNDKIWSELNEDAIDSKTFVLLSQNGLRAATGSVARWPAIAKLMDPTGTSHEPFILQTDGRTSINVKTRLNITDEIVVSVDHDHQLQGRTFERCDNGFRLSVRGVRDKAELQVQLEPVVTLGTMQIARPGMGLTNAAITSEESFEDLRVSATLTGDQFMVIAAKNPKPGNYSVGTLWLSNLDGVPATETVLVFVPAGK